MKFTIMAALAATVLLSSSFTALAGQAKHHKRPFAWNGTYDETYVTKEPVHGYSGPALNSFPPDSFIHCDYHRIPIRGCDSAGRCKAVAWKLEQYCY